MTQTRPDLLRTLENDLRSKVFLFVGYSLRDPDFNAVYSNVFYRMGDMHKAHFIALAEDPGPNERQDLLAQGLIPIPLWGYGSKATERTCGFLRKLVRETADLRHLRSYYHGVKAGETIPIVIPSRIDDEGHALYPSPDIHTANDLSNHLRRIDVAARIVPDVLAVREADALLRDHVIIVCSPAGNAFTKVVFDRAASRHLQDPRAF